MLTVDPFDSLDPILNNAVDNVVDTKHVSTYNPAYPCKHTVDLGEFGSYDFVDDGKARPLDLDLLDIMLDEIEVSDSEIQDALDDPALDDVILPFTFED